MSSSLQVGPVRIGGDAPLAVIAGPCLAESYELCMAIGGAMRDRCAELGLGYIFKGSFDKANRSSIASYRGAGLDAGLELLAKVRQALGTAATTDIHESHQAEPVSQVVDLLQIPAFLCRQTDLLIAAAQTGKPVNVKKGQFLSPAEMQNVIDKLNEAAKSEERGAKGEVRGSAHSGNDHGRSSTSSGGIMLTERGTFFGYHRLVNDFVGLGDLIDLGLPVCFDATHSTQQPGSGATSGGRPDRAPLLARAAVAAGVDAVFIETHPDPASAKSDAASMLPLDRALKLLDELARLRQAI